MAAVEELSSLIGVRRACQDLSTPRSSVYRRRRRLLSPPPARALRSLARRLKGVAPEQVKADGYLLAAAPRQKRCTRRHS
jgi:hypothetical protein